MADSKVERGAAQRGSQVIALLYSILFVFLIASGYYLLFQRNLLLAITASLLFACLAWWLARFIGNSRAGIRGHVPLFALLLLISAVGVFNSLMLNLEGRRIFIETIDDSYDRFDKLKLQAGRELSKGGSTSPLAHIQRVDGLKAALFSEIRNPLNCGQGPEARKIVSDLRAELPEFRPLSEKGIDCSQNARVIDDYDRRISDAVQRAPWNNQLLIRVVTDSAAAQTDLDGMRKTAEASFAVRLLQEVEPQLEVKNSQYRDLRQRLPTEEAATGLPVRLNLQQVESLGEWSQLVYLLINRWDKPTTYIYLALAGFADWMMVHLFSLVRTNRRRRPDGDAGGTEMARAF